MMHHERDSYLTRFDTELRHRLKANREPNVDDIAQEENLRLLRRFDIISSRYDDPILYARVRVRQARADHYRADNRQRGAGVLFRRDDNGAVAAGREVVSGEASLDEAGGSAFDSLRDWSVDVEAKVLDDDAVSKMLAAARYALGGDGAQIFCMSVIEGYNDIEIGASLGLARETVNRKKNKAIRTVKGTFDASRVE